MTPASFRDGALAPDPESRDSGCDAVAPLRNDHLTKRPVAISDDGPHLIRDAVPKTHRGRRRDRTCLDGRSARRRYETTSAVTRPTPAPIRPMARAAPVERSSTRPRTNGPRSLTVTMTLRSPWVTLNLVPNGSDRWAAVMAFWLKCWPEAVRLPDSLP